MANQDGCSAYSEQFTTFLDDEWYEEDVNEYDPYEDDLGER